MVDSEEEENGEAGVHVQNGEVVDGQNVVAVEEDDGDDHQNGVEESVDIAVVHMFHVGC